jgi:DNA-binding response OmpR family regulator
MLPPRVLIVDDYAIFAEVLKRKLSRSGCEVDVVSSGEQAIASAQMSLPSILILELDLPDMSGIQLLQIFRKTATLGEVPAIIVTGRSEQHLLCAAEAFGVSRIFIKSRFTLDELIDCICRLQRRRFAFATDA